MLKASLSSRVQLEIEDSSDWLVFTDIFLNRAYEPFLREFIKRHRSIYWNVVDLGCNVGYGSLFMLDTLLRYGYSEFKFLGIDANEKMVPKYLKRMQNQPHINMLDKVHATFGAVGAQITGETRLTLDPFHAQSHLDEKDKGSIVPYINWTNGLDEMTTVLKVDIEGCEEGMIETYQDYLKQNVFACVFEFHEAECDIDHCRFMLEESGFKPLSKTVAGNTSVEGFCK